MITLLTVFVLNAACLVGGFLIGRVYQAQQSGRHTHYWEVVEKTIQPSSVEILKESGQTIKKLTNGESLQSLTRQRALVRYRCNTCGAEKMERI